jgi:uncharacterized phage-associated protein
MHSSIQVANRLLQIATEAGRYLTPMQILKLVYICHGWMLGLYGRPLIGEEIQAWKYGPVVPSLYRFVRDYGGTAIMKPLPGSTTSPFDPLEDDLINQVFHKYGIYDGVTLSQMTHEEGSPWDQVWRPSARNLVIPDEIIEAYYRDLAAQGDGQQ